ncbi:unnamed protein product [Brachionus calyciflorus]|uniref:Uncharacterized protein n=1 Tax=Brachionus calyciflorus TaxID=104777 RepID=A0A814E377_9BILA|nr:unnamed protein product [Brachionus calyciflorus]
MNNSESTFHKHVPVFPLPEEILKMERDETVCQFCGVSYLIHNEIKKLEDKIKELEVKLKDYDLMKNKILNYDQINDDLNLKVQDLEEKLSDRIQIISSLNNDIESKNIEKARLNRKIEDLENENYLNISKIEGLKNKMLKYELVVKETELKLSTQKSDLKLIELNTKDQLSFMTQCMNSLRTQVDRYAQKISKESLDKSEIENDLRSQVKELLRENDSFKETLSSYTKQISSFQGVKNELETQIHILQNKLTQSDELNTKFVHYEREKRKLLEENSNLRQEMDKIKLNSNNLVIENSELNEKLSLVQEKIDQANLKYQNDLKIKNDEMQRYKNELVQVKKRYADQEKFESEILANNQNNLSEINRLKLEVNKANDQINDLESEIKQLTLAHQCQITQLKDSFKEKMKRNNEWPDKLESELKKEREKHAHEINKIQDELKQNFKLELEVHNQKYDELYIKYQKMISENESISKTSLAKLQSDNRNLIEQLKNIHEEKLKNEKKLKTDLENLRVITKDLHERLDKYSNDDTETSNENLKTKMIQKDSIIDELESKLKNHESQIENFKEEIRVLQETVHNECLERDELLEKLEKARDELLMFKKNAYSSQQLIPLNTSMNRSPKSHNQQALINLDYAKNTSDIESQKQNMSLNTSIRRNSTPNALNRTGSEKSQPESISKVVNDTTTGRQQRAKLINRETLSLLNTNQSNEPIQLFKKINELSNITNKNKSGLNHSGNLINSSNAENKKRISLLLARKS